MTEHSTEGVRVPDRKLLVIDDNAGFRALVARAARPLGWQVESLANGEALHARSDDSTDVDLILLDVMMPGSDGFDAIDQIAVKHPKSTVILVTGGPAVFAEAARDFADKRSVNVEMLLTKPIPIQELQAILR